MDFPLKRSGCCFFFYHIPVQKGFSWKETYPHQPTPLVPSSLNSHRHPPLGRPYQGSDSRKGASPTPTPPQDTQHDQQLGDPVLTSAGTKKGFVDPTRPAACARVPPLSCSPGASFHLRLGSLSSNRDYAGLLPPVLVPARVWVSGWAASSRASRLFLREKLRSRSPRASKSCRAARRRQRR